MIQFLVVCAVLIAGVLVFLFFSSRRNLSGHEDRALSKRTLIGLAVLVPSAAAILYFMVGTPQATRVPTLPTNPAEQSAKGHDLEHMEQLVERLADRLKKQPDDLEGWMLLARSYTVLGRSEEAKAAFSKADPLKNKAKKNTASTAQVSGTVVLDPKMLSQVSLADTVFVFAKASSGPQPPLAALRFSVKDLPAHFVLDDMLAISPDKKLSDFSQVILEARVTKSGNPSATPGDLEGSRPGIKVGSQNVTVTIDHVVP